MFDKDTSDSIFAAISPPADVAASPAEPARVPLERVEAQICELAGHLAAATCRFLVLLGDFDARRGWASWEMGSCAQWLSWKCQMSSGTAREHVRVARALRDLPVIRARFAAGRLSYAKVRALTRIAAPGTEAGLAELAAPMTANQLERFARAHRQVTAADDAEARVRRRLAWRFEEDGSLSGTFRLPPLQGAVLLKALRAACAGLAGDPRPDVSAETPAAPETPAADTQAVRTSSDLADGLVAVAESFLAAKVAGADDAEVYQVVVHAGTDALTEPPVPAADPGVSAETPADPGPGPRRPGRPGPVPRPGRPGDQRVHRPDARLHRGAVLDDPRRRRRRPGPRPAPPPPQLRDPPRRPGTGRLPVPVPGLRVPPHRPAPHPALGQRRPHRPGQPDQLVPLAPQGGPRPRLPHRRPARRHLRVLPPGRHPAAACPPLPAPQGGIGTAHDADITPDTIIPPWYGERLDLNHAIWACFANARTRDERERDPDGPPRGRVTIYEPEDCDERYRQYLEHAPRYTGPTLIPIPV